MLHTLRNFQSFDADNYASPQNYELLLKEPKTPSIFDQYDETRSSQLAAQISTLQPLGIKAVGVRSKSRLYDQARLK